MTSKSSYFPLFIDISHKNILLVGGGKIAKDKLEKLLDFTQNITIVSKEFSKEITELINRYNLIYHDRAYQKSDLNDVDIVISAVDSIEVQKMIYHDSRGKNILVNSVDSKEFSDFIFGSYIKDDSLVIAISTSGTSPSVAKYLKRFLKKALPKNLSALLRKLKQTRESMPKGRDRMQLLDDITKDFFDKTQ